MNEKDMYIEELSEICEVSIMNATTQTFCFEVKYTYYFSSAYSYFMLLCVCLVSWGP
jgi:hypothetical protein